MKKLSLLAFAGSLFFAVSCEDDDTPNYVSPNYLTGEWNLVQEGSLTPGGLTVDYFDVAGSCDENDEIIFGEGNTFSINDSSEAGEACTAVNTSGTYTRDNRDVTLTSGTTSTTVSVITLTFDTLIYSYPDSETGELVFLKYEKQ